MAIRIGLPPTIAPQLRVRWRATRAHLTGQIHALQTNTARLFQAPFVWGKQLVSHFQHRWSLHKRLLRRQIALLNAFEEHYEQLVDLLCWAAQEGAHTKQNASYHEIRTWMCSHYSQIRSRLRPYWTDPNGPTAYDPFEALFMPEQVSAVLNATTSIEDMMLCQQALNRYRDALDAQHRCF